MRRASLPAGLTLLGALLLAPGAAAQKWTDRAEYDLVLSIRTESAPDRRLALIDEWRKKYPKTELRLARAELDLSAAQAAASWDRVRSAARELLAAAPDHLVGLYWSALLAPGMKDPAESDIAEAERAARRLLDGLDKHFAASAMPAGMAAPEWAKRRKETEILARRTLGWVGLQRKAYSDAEREFTACLEKDQGDAQSSAWLGTTLALEKTAERQTQALWHLARAAYSDGDASLGSTQRQDVRALLEKFYTAFHGSADGLAELGASAKSAPFPPAGFRVETAAAVAERRQEEELARTNPELAAWNKIRKGLDSAEGDRYFTENWKDHTLPSLKGRVVRCAPAMRPTEIFLSMADSAGAEVRLTLDRPFPNRAEPGTELSFEGSGVSFTGQPFLLTLGVERDKIVGWPAPAGKR